MRRVCQVALDIPHELLVADPEHTTQAPVDGGARPSLTQGDADLLAVSEERHAPLALPPWVVIGHAEVSRESSRRRWSEDLDGFGQNMIRYCIKER